MELLTSVGTALVAALSKRAKTLGQWIFEITFSLILLSLFFGMLLESLSRNDVTLDPVAAAYRMAAVFGIADTGWIYNTIEWLERPALAPIAALASALSGILVFLGSRYSGDIAWLLLLAFSVTLGSQAFLIAMGVLTATTLFLGLGAWINKYIEFTDNGRKWLDPGDAVRQATQGIIFWILSPFTLVLRLWNRVVETVTYEPRGTGVAAGAVPLQKEGQY